MVTHNRLIHPKCTYRAVNLHTPWTHTRSSGQPFLLQHPGSSWGFGALLKGTSVVVLRVLYIHSPHLQFLPDRDSNSQPLDYTDLSCLLSLFYKSTMFCCYCECIHKKIVFTDSKDVLLLSVWPKMYFQSKWAHQRLYLSCSERTTFHTPHRHLNSAHFSWLTLDWVAI